MGLRTVAAASTGAPGERLLEVCALCRGPNAWGCPNTMPCVCTGCFSSVDVTAVKAGAGLTLAALIGHRVVDRVRSRSSADRRRAAYDANAAFLQDLGHQPDHVLGPRPAGAKRGMPPGDAGGGHPTPSGSWAATSVRARA